MPKRKRTFRIEIEATVDVDAFDEDSALRKIAAALKLGRPIGEDVRSAGDSRSYHVEQLDGMVPVG